MKTSSASALQNSRVHRRKPSHASIILNLLRDSAKLAREVAERINVSLTQLYRLHERDHLFSGKPIVLKTGEVRQLSGGCDKTTLEVQSGVLWLTSTPAVSDVLLRAGDQYPLGAHAPYVIQALKGSSAIFRLKNECQ